MKKSELIKMKISLETDIRDYQLKGKNFLFEHNKAILAMCPGAGKTVTSLYGIICFLLDNPEARVLVLTHSTKVLLDNFMSEVNDWGLKELCSDNFDMNKRVHVCLPQNIKKINLKYDLLVVDEAHENYLSKKSIKNEEEESATNEYVMQQIIKKITKRGTILKQWLLTGTPSKFIKKGGFDLYTVAINEIDKKFRAKLNIELISTNANWKDFYNKDFNLSGNAIITKEASLKTIKEVISVLKKRFTLTNKDKKSKKPFSKTLFVCKDTNHANDVYDILHSMGINCAISHCKSDLDSRIIRKFKNNEYDALVVIKRARLGYSDTDLFNMVDFSGTHNIDLIYQMLSRVVRGNQTMKKLFIKITTEEQSMRESTNAYTNAALQLTDAKYLSTFNGDNFSINIIKDKATGDVIRFYKNSSKGKSSNNISSGQRAINSELENDIIESIKNINKNLSKNVSLFGEVTLEKAIDIIRGYNNWSRFEYVFDDAQRFKSIPEWIKLGRNSYQSAFRNGWLVECTAHMEQPEFPRGYFQIKENNKKYALLFDDYNEFKKNKLARQATIDNGWTEEHCSHMKNVPNKKPKGYWDIFENVKKDSLRFDCPSEWSDLSNVSYTSARINGWLKTLTKRMKNPSAKIVLMKNAITGKLIKKFNSTVDAAKYVRGDSSQISKCCLGKAKKSKGYIWEYEKTLA